MKKIVDINAVKRCIYKLVEEETPSRELGFAKGEISDLSDSAWEALDDEFNALFANESFC
jgi:hypothetical protein